MLLFTVLLGFMYIVTCAFSYWRGQEIDRLERELYDAETFVSIDEIGRASCRERVSSPV